ncbi:TKL family protein kinase [Trichomonas vaginalis G3]|uniref:TKL family protein kinase n=1 Tax=Trichomonas vaginalis (strain ATCC PRA-98 / G3) TaxID=412133 RepID=A2EJ56_TRIV3|nr:protein kinase protein [Trichomonas vaginalis G3]EAY07288.1 TKL family protein kinase [Trichomonas vaginalis G3]KAI5550461.1 protein kinase protein [Trichomonas vaginalis G3]|eukprot:XP_001319511.1 TKL family protein kinase [Trichomonas vaginalis G3]
MTEALERRFVSEVCALYRCQHPFLLGLIGFSNAPPYIIVTEYISNANLREFIHDKQFQSKRTGTTLTKIAMGIASGMSFFHAQKLMHRDLKPDNVILDNDFLPKICDFGLTREFDKPSTPTHKIGTRYYMAPEVIQNGVAYDEKCDVYSYGVILFQMLTQKVPFFDASPEDFNVMIIKGKREPIPYNCPPNLKRLISDCWSENLFVRPPFSLIYEMFATGKVAFPDTNQEEIKEFAESIEIRTMYIRAKPEIYRKTDEKTSKVRTIPFEKNENFIAEPPVYIHKPREKEPPKEENKSNIKSKTTEKEPEIIESESEESEEKILNQNKKIQFTLDSDALKPKIFELDSKIKSKKSLNSNYSSSRQYRLKSNISYSNSSDPDTNKPTKLTGIAKFPSKNVVSLPFDNSESEEEVYIHKPKKPKQSRQKAPEMFEYYYEYSESDREIAPSIRTPAINLVKSRNIDDEDLEAEKIFANVNSPYYASKSTINLNVIKDMNHPLFEIELSKINEKMEIKILKKFLSIAHNHIRESSNKEKTLKILETVASIMKNEEICDEFDKLSFKTILPYDDIDYLDAIMMILTNIFTIKPQIFQKNFKQVMTRLFAAKPKKSLILMSKFAEKFDLIENPWGLLDNMLKNYKIFIDIKEGSQFLKILADLLRNFPVFKESRFDSCKKLFPSFILSQNEDTVISAYQTITDFYDSSMNLPYDKIISDLDDKNISQYCIQLLLVVKKLPKVPKLVYKIIKFARKSENAASLVQRLVKKQSSAMELCERTNWLLYELPTLNSSITILLRILEHNECCKLIVHAPELPPFLVSILKYNSKRSASTLPHIFNALDIDNEFKDSLESVDFFKILIRKMEKGKSSIKLSLLQTIDYILSKTYSHDILYAIDDFVQYFADNNDDIREQSLRIVLSLSKYKKSRKTLINRQVIEIATKSFEKDLMLKNVIKKLIKNINGNQNNANP